jgi:hypothetical protein
MLKVAVVTPYYQEPQDWLIQCHESVANQSYPCTHIMVADGYSNELVGRLGVLHIPLPRRHRDYPSSVTLRNTKQQESQTIHQEKRVEIDSWHELTRENRAINYD